MKFQDISQIKNRSNDKIKDDFIGKSLDNIEINNNFLGENVTKSCMMTNKDNLNKENFNQKSAKFLNRNSDIYFSQKKANNLNLNEIKPILIIDVKLKEGLTKHIKVFEADTSEKLSTEFSEENSKI